MVWTKTTNIFDLEKKLGDPLTGAGGGQPIETCLSDFHKLVMKSFHSTYKRLRPTKIQYRSYKKFNEADFLKDITDAPFDKCLKIRDSEAAYDSFKDTFLSITNRHAPLVLH